MKTKLLTTAAVLGFAALGLTVGSRAAHAGSITNTYDVPTAGLTDTNYSGNVSIAGFSMAGQTLDSATITLTEMLVGTAQAENTSTTAPGTGYISLSNTAKATVTATDQVVTVNTQMTPTFPLAPGQTSTLYHLSGSATNSQTFTSNLSTYTAPFFTVGYSDVGLTSSAFSGGNEKVTVTDAGELEIGVTYNYSPTTTVPEPASIALLGSGLIGLGFVRRRRNKA